jgi:uncharacterized protein
MASPFVYEEPVDPASLIDRESEVAVLVDRLLDGRNSRVEAPRRFGKTSLLRKVLAAVEQDGLVPVYVNFLGVLTAGDVAERIERAYREQLDSTLHAWFTGLVRTLRPTLRTPPGSPVGIDVSPTAPEQALLDRLSLPRRLHAKHGRRCAIVFDEFQDVISVGEALTGTIRSELEQHGDAAAYVFSGSHPGLMRELFVSRRRAFFGQATPISVGPLDLVVLAEHIAARFTHAGRDVGGALDPLLALSNGHPQRAMLLAHQIFEHTGPRETADTDTWQAALEATCLEVDAEVQGLWERLNATQRKLISLIADNAMAVNAVAAREVYGLPKTGSNRGALLALQATGEIVSHPGSASGWSVVDPLLALWLRGGRRWG